MLLALGGKRVSSESPKGIDWSNTWKDYEMFVFHASAQRWPTHYRLRQMQRLDCNCHEWMKEGKKKVKIISRSWAQRGNESAYSAMRKYCTCLLTNSSSSMSASVSARTVCKSALLLSLPPLPLLLIVVACWNASMDHAAAAAVLDCIALLYCLKVDMSAHLAATTTTKNGHWEGERESEKCMVWYGMYCMV